MNHEKTNYSFIEPIFLKFLNFLTVSAETMDLPIFMEVLWGVHFALFNHVSARLHISRNFWHIEKLINLCSRDPQHFLSPIYSILDTLVLYEENNFIDKLFAFDFLDIFCQHLSFACLLPENQCKMYKVLSRLATSPSRNSTIISHSQLIAQMMHEAFRTHSLEVKREIANVLLFVTEFPTAENTRILMENNVVELLMGDTINFNNSYDDYLEILQNLLKGGEFLVDRDRYHTNPIAAQIQHVSGGVAFIESFADTSEFASSIIEFSTKWK